MPQDVKLFQLQYMLTQQEAELSLTKNKLYVVSTVYNDTHCKVYPKTT